MSRNLTPALLAIIYPSPVTPSGFVVKEYIFPDPPQAITVLLARQINNSSVLLFTANAPITLLSFFINSKAAVFLNISTPSFSR